MIVKEVPIREIKVKDRAREDMGDITALADSIKAVGLLQPITLDENMNLLAGERRLEAHKKLDRQTIPAVTRPARTKGDKAEIELFENIHRKDLTWPERCKLELKYFNLKIDEHGEYNASTGKGWSQNKQAAATGKSQTEVHRNLELAETLEVLPELSEFENETDAYKETKKLEENLTIYQMKKKIPTHIELAPQWAKDHYKIGDALVEMRKLAVEPPLVHFAEVDPPYGVDLDKRKSRNTDGTLMTEYFEWDDYLEKFMEVAELVYKIVQPNSFAVFWYGMSWHHEVLTILRKVGWGVPDIPAVWVKGGSGQTAQPDTTLGSCYEPFFLARKGQPKLARAGRGNVFYHDKVYKKHHPTEKPLSLMMDMLETIVFPGSIIMIPFLGSGVTLRAAYKMGHTGYGWDLSETYKEGFLKRVGEDHGTGLSKTETSAEPSAVGSVAGDSEEDGLEAGGVPA